MLSLIGLLTLAASKVLSSQHLEIRMPNVTVPEDDFYFCHSQLITTREPLWIVGVELASTHDFRLHHLSVGVCEDAQKGVWECRPGKKRNACKSGARNLWSWNDRHTDKKQWKLPEGAGIHIGAGSRYKFLVLQTHYAHALAGSETDDSGALLDVTTERMPYSTLTLVTGTSGYVPAHAQNFVAEAACDWQGPEAEIVQYKVHTHEAGMLVEGYLVRNGSFTLIGRMSPQRSQAYLPVHGNQPLNVLSGDYVVARCYYRNVVGQRINFGARHADEMCNLYVLARYPADASTLWDTQTCVKNSQDFRLKNQWPVGPKPLPESEVQTL